jgi:hypothetical protein
VHGASIGGGGGGGSNPLAALVFGHPRCEQLVSHCVHRAMLPQWKSKPGCECAQRQRWAESMGRPRNGGRVEEASEQGCAPNIEGVSATEPVVDARLAEDEIGVPTVPAAVRCYLDVQPPEPDFGAMCGMCGHGCSQRLDDVFAVLTALVAAQQQHNQGNRLLIDGATLEGLVKRASLLLEATAHSHEIAGTNQYDSCGFGLSGALIPRCTHIGRSGWAFASAGLEVGQFIVQAAAISQAGPLQQGGVAAARIIAASLRDSKSLTVLDEFAPIVGLLMALVVDLKARPPNSAAICCQLLPEGADASEATDDICLGLAGLMSAFEDFADASWAPRWFEPLPALIDLFEHAYFWQQRRVHPTDATSLPPKATGYWIAPTSCPSQLLAVLAAHAVHHVARIGLSSVLLHKDSTERTQHVVAGVLAPLKLGPNVGALWGTSSATMDQFQNFSTMCMSTVEHIMSGPSRHELTPLFQHDSQSQQSACQLQTWVQRTMDSAADDNSAEAGCRVVYVLYLIERMDAVPAPTSPTIWAAARTLIGAAVKALATEILGMIAKDVISAQDWDLDRLHSCICGLYWLTRSTSTSFVHFVDAAANQIMECFVQVVRRSSRDGYSGAWIGSTFGSIMAALVERAYAAATLPCCTFVSNLLTACSQLFMESGSRRSNHERAMLIIPPCTVLRTILGHDVDLLPGDSTRLLLDALRHCDHAIICHADVISVLAVAIRIAAVSDDHQTLEECTTEVATVMEGKLYGLPTVQALVQALVEVAQSPVCTATLAQCYTDVHGHVYLGARTGPPSKVHAEQVVLNWSAVLATAPDVVRRIDCPRGLAEMLLSPPMDITSGTWDPDVVDKHPAAQLMPQLLTAMVQEGQNVAAQAVLRNRGVLQWLVRGLRSQFSAAQRCCSATEWWVGVRRGVDQSFLSLTLCLVGSKAGEQAVDIASDDLLCELQELLADIMSSVATPAMNDQAYQAACLLATLAARPRVSLLLKSNMGTVRLARSLLVAHEQLSTTDEQSIADGPDRIRPTTSTAVRSFPWTRSVLFAEVCLSFYVQTVGILNHACIRVCAVGGWVRVRVSSARNSCGWRSSKRRTPSPVLSRYCHATFSERCCIACVPCRASSGRYILWQQLPLGSQHGQQPGNLWAGQAELLRH